MRREVDARTVEAHRRDRQLEPRVAHTVAPHVAKCVGT